MNKLGYTLIELVVVMGIVIVLLVTTTSLFYTMLIAGGKTGTSEAVKQAGQNALNQLTYLIFNSRKLVENNEAQICVADMVSLGIQNQDLQTTILAAEDDDGHIRIASNAGQFLTPQNMTVSQGPTFTCITPASGSAPTIQISFTLQKGVVGIDRPRDIVSIPFSTQITLRNSL